MNPFEKVIATRVMEREASLRILAERKNLALIREFVKERASAAGASRAQVDDLVQAVDEAATNIVVHGYQDQPGMIELRFSLRDKEMRVVLRDQAPPFDPRKVPPPNLALPLHKRPVGGLGVHLIRKCVDDFLYRQTEEGGNELTLVKRLE